MKIAIMQPYFIPYAGYFRLFCAADLFVIYDCVQFPRRGWVHRNQLYNQTRQLDWVTLPLQKQPVETYIKDLKFRSDAASEWQRNLDRFSALTFVQKKYPKLFGALTDMNVTPAVYIVNSLREICSILDIPFNIMYSASLNLVPSIKGQDRILQIAKHYQATDYINAPGGRELYQENEFQQHGIRLHFLPEFKGDYHSIVQSLMDHEPSQIRDMLFAQSVI